MISFENYCSALTGKIEEAGEKPDTNDFFVQLQPKQILIIVPLIIKVCVAKSPVGIVTSSTILIYRNSPIKFEPYCHLNENEELQLPDEISPVLTTDNLLQRYFKYISTKKGVVVGIILPLSLLCGGSYLIWPNTFKSGGSFLIGLIIKDKTAADSAAENANPTMEQVTRTENNSSCASTIDFTVANDVKTLVNKTKNKVKKLETKWSALVENKFNVDLKDPSLTSFSLSNIEINPSDLNTLQLIKRLLHETRKELNEAKVLLVNLCKQIPDL